jgi:hypothetical protein
VSSISFGAGKLIQSFKTEANQEISFNSYSPGLNIYLKDKSSKSYRRSISFRYNIIHGVKQYSYNSFSVGYSFNFKSGSKISDQQRSSLDTEFKIIK